MVALLLFILATLEKKGRKRSILAQPPFSKSRQILSLWFDISVEECSIHKIERDIYC